jgi:hypothetical protein
MDHSHKASRPADLEALAKTLLSAPVCLTGCRLIPGLLLRLDFDRPDHTETIVQLAFVVVSARLGKLHLESRAPVCPWR